ncbi:putative deoxyribonuclease TATDN2 [Bombina bombina]|uniref:putative deoxyribonuclease TATDN2 n=1 Tax=Bombina bombina TaxID=8345 RepID=UPI00235AA169|nr:putative deoxyribonuclease TATDN2 [Bombina bombina]
MASGRRVTLKHKLSDHTELSPRKYLKSGQSSKLPRTVSETTDHGTESPSVAEERHVNLYTCEAMSNVKKGFHTMNTEDTSSSSRRVSFRGRLRRSWPLYQQTDVQEPVEIRESRHSPALQCKLETETKKSPVDPDNIQKDDPRRRRRSTQPSTMLFKKAFRDIIGTPIKKQASTCSSPENECSKKSNSLLHKVSSATNVDNKPEVNYSTESNQPILRDADILHCSPERDLNHLLQKEKKPIEKSEHNHLLAKENETMVMAVPDSIYTYQLPEPAADIKEETSRLVFLYEDDNDKDLGVDNNSEKDPSIGSDFSDIEDIESLARFSQEEQADSSYQLSEASYQLSEASTSSNYVTYPLHLYRNYSYNYAQPWTSSPLPKACTQGSTWRQNESNISRLSEPSTDLIENSFLSASSDGDMSGNLHRNRSGSFDTAWICESANKLMRRHSDVHIPVDHSKTPKFLQEGFIDTHCHLDMLFSKLSFRSSFAELRDNYSSTFPREFQGCIADFCDPGTLDNNQWEHLLGEDMVWGAFGCHPHFAQYYDSRKQDAIMNAMRHPKAIAYGEMGLDYSHKCSTTIPMQHTVFEKQLKLAVALGKPLVIHCRNADEDLFQILKKLVPYDYKMHRHCFTGNYNQIEPFLKEFPNMSVGFTALLTYPSAEDAREAMRQIPLERLIVETDAPFFLPKQVPKSFCKFAHPGVAIHTIQEMAKQKNLTLASVLSALRQNTKQLYNV